MKYEDGDFAPPEIIDRWLTLLDTAFGKKKMAADHDPPTVAVHCVAGNFKHPSYRHYRNYGMNFRSLDKVLNEILMNMALNLYVYILLAKCRYKRCERR